MKTIITGTGSSLPKKVLTNDELSNMVETSDDWIRTRTGIRERRIAETETTYTMGAEAAKIAMNERNILACDIELLIVATSSAEYAFPNTASLIQDLIGTKNALCFDVSVACSGFIVALSIADAMMKLGLARKALVIGTEVLSKQVDWNDRSVCVLFGDGAGAVLLESVDEKICKIDTDKSRFNKTTDACKRGILDQDVHSDGSDAMVLTCEKSTKKDVNEEEVQSETIQMNGQEVFKFAVKKVPESIDKLLKRNQLTVDDIDLFVLHQANERIIESVAKRLKADKKKFPMNMDKYGNTSAASIPILLHELNCEHKLQPGKLLILSGFGAGLSWGSLLIRV